MTTTEVRQKATELARGELTLTRLDFVLIGTILLLAGICIGLLSAPLHMVSVCSAIMGTITETTAETAVLWTTAA